MARRQRFSVSYTAARHLPYEVIDSQRYGDVMAQCRSRAIALLLAKGLNETRPNRNGPLAPASCGPGTPGGAA